MCEALNHSLSIARFRLRKWRWLVGVLKWKALGMQLGHDSQIGAIKCDWPSQVSIGPRTVIEDNVVFKINHPFCPKKAISIGRDVFIGEECYFNVSAGVEIGSDSLLAARVMIADVGHEFRAHGFVRAQQVISKPVKVGRDVWIGTCSILLPGVNVDDRAIVGAGSVVTKSVPSAEIWAGVPARRIGSRED